jgi:dihydrodipicolinate synthase/N-acetylneuraminate lyase
MGIAGVKYAMDFRGFYGGLVRLPLPSLGESQKKEVGTLVAALAPAAATA